MPRDAIKPARTRKAGADLLVFKASEVVVEGGPDVGVVEPIYTRRSFLIKRVLTHNYLTTTIEVEGWLTWQVERQARVTEARGER